MLLGTHTHTHILVYANTHALTNTRIYIYHICINTYIIYTVYVGIYRVSAKELLYLLMYYNNYENVVYIIRNIKFWIYLKQMLVDNYAS